MVFALAAVLAACGDDDNANKTNDAGAAQSAAATTVATKPSGGASATAAASNAGSGSGRIADLRSFEYEMSFTGLTELIGAVSGTGTAPPNAGEVKIKGAYKGPDRASFTMNLGGQELTNVIIGNQQW